MPRWSIGPVIASAEWRFRGVAVDVTDTDLEAASMAWQAYQTADAGARGSICSARTSASCRNFGRPAEELLEELPMPATGLGATEMRMLELIAAGNATPFDVFPGYLEKRNTRRVFEYREIGELLDGLARCPGTCRGRPRGRDRSRMRCMPTRGTATSDTAKYAGADGFRRGRPRGHRGFQPAQPDSSLVGRDAN